MTATPRTWTVSTALVTSLLLTLSAGCPPDDNRASSDPSSASPSSSSSLFSSSSSASSSGTEPPSSLVEPSSGSTSSPGVTSSSDAPPSSSLTAPSSAGASSAGASSSGPVPASSTSAPSSSAAPTHAAGTCGAPLDLVCGQTYVVDTSTGTAALSAYPSCDNVGFQFPSAESVFRFAPALFTRATFTVRRTGTGATTWILFALDGNDAGCGGGLPCLGQADDYDPTLNLAVHGGNLVFLSYDARVTSGASTTMTLEVTCTVTQCGDGEVGEGETCDDDETEDLDGCSGTCQVEEGWACSGTPSTCREVTCGDGFIDAPEECDDDEDERGDGCDDDCHVEDGWECTGEPSTCTQTRGDTCADAPTVSAPTTLSGSTESYSADVSEWLGTCRVNYAARDRFYKVAVPTGKVLYAHVATPADYPSLRLLLSASCPDSAATCFHEAPASSLRWLNNTGVTRNVYLALDSMLANDQGSYALSVEFEDPASYAAGHTCLHAQRLSTAESGGTQTVSGNTTASLDYYHGYLGDCATAHYGLPGLAGGPELVYVVNVPAGKQLLVNSSATWDHVVAIADNCADLQASCRSWKDSGDPSVRNGSGADKDYYVVVDGFFAYTKGDFTLTVTLAD